jgi:hypothetical protein
MKIQAMSYYVTPQKNYETQKQQGFGMVIQNELLAAGRRWIDSAGITEMNKLPLRIREKMPLHGGGKKGLQGVFNRHINYLQTLWGEDVSLAYSNGLSANELYLKNVSSGFTRKYTAVHDGKDAFMALMSFDAIEHNMLKNN